MHVITGKMMFRGSIQNRLMKWWENNYRYQLVAKSIIRLKYESSIAMGNIDVDDYCFYVLLSNYRDRPATFASI